MKKLNIKAVEAENMKEPFPDVLSYRSEADCQSLYKKNYSTDPNTNWYE